MYKTLGDTFFRGEESMCEGEALFAAAVVNVHNYAWTAFLVVPSMFVGLILGWPQMTTLLSAKTNHGRTNYDP